MTHEEVTFDDLNPPEEAIVTSGRACSVRYRLSSSYVAASGDWVGLFRCTDDTCELVGYEWAATEDPKISGAGQHHRRKMLYFRADQIKRPLRASDDDFYHFAYVTRVGRIAGQSGHFRIRQGDDPTTARSTSGHTSLGPADVCYAARQCLAKCRMLPITDGRNTQALEKFQGVIDQLEMRRYNDCCQSALWQNGCDDQIPGKVVDSPNRLRNSCPKSDPKSCCLRLETMSQSRCHGCQLALRELRSLKHRLEMELNAGRTTIEELEEDLEAQRQGRAAQQQQKMIVRSKETAAVKEEELLDVIGDLKLALDWSKERERCLQHQLNMERTLRMELIRSREEIENSRTVIGMQSVSRQEPQRFQVDVIDTSSSQTVTKDTKSASRDSLESPIPRYVQEKDIRGKRVLVCADCLQHKDQPKDHVQQQQQQQQQQQPQQQYHHHQQQYQQQQYQQQQYQQQQHPSISIDRPRRSKKFDEPETESGRVPPKRLVMATDPDIYLKEDQLARELLLRQTVDVDEQVVPIALQEMEMMSRVEVCDPVRPSEVLMEESVQKVPDLQPIRECLGEILALQAAVETSLSEINSKKDVSPVVSKKSEVRGTGNVAADAVKEPTISPAVGASLDAEKKSTNPEAVVSTKDGKSSIVNTVVHSERKSCDRKAFKPPIAEKPASIQSPTNDQLTTRANTSRKSDRQPSPGNTTVIVKSRDSLTTYSGSNLSLWLLLGNDSEPDRIIAKQTRRGSHKSQRPPRGYDLITETKYRGSSSSNAPNADHIERTRGGSSGTNEVARKRRDDDEDEFWAAAVRAVCDQAPSSNANNDGLKETNRTAEEIYTVDVRTPEVKRSFGHSASPIVSAINAPQQMSSAATEQRSATHQDISSSVTSHQLGHDSALSAAMLSSIENLTDASSLLPNHGETSYKNTVDNTAYYHILSTSPNPNDYGVDESLNIPVIFAMPTSAAVESISSAFSAVTKEHSATDFNRSRHELAVLSTPAPDSDAQQSTKPDATCHNRTTQAEAHHQSTDASSSSSADPTNANRYSKSAGKVTCPEGGIHLHLYSGTLRSSPSSGTNDEDVDDVELIRRLSEMGTGSNAVLLEPEERKEESQKAPLGDPVFTSSSRFCFISDETIRCLSGILDSAMELTAAFKQLDGAASPAPTARPSEVTVTDTAKSTVYSEEEESSAASSFPTVEQHNPRQVKIIKPMPFGRAMGGVRPTDPVASGMRSGRGMNARHPGMAAFQNARIISDSIREYHRKMKSNAEFPEETPRALKVAEQYSFPDPPKAGRGGKPNATTESGAISSTREQQSIKALPEETVSQTAVAGGGVGGGGASVDLSSPSATSVTTPNVKASTTMTTESGAVTCCPKTSLVQPQDPSSLDLGRCECEAHHRHPLPADDKQQDGGSSTEEDGSPKEAATASEGPHQRLHSTDAGALTMTSGDLSIDLRPSEADTAAGSDGVSQTVDGASSSSVKTTGTELEPPPTDLSMAANGSE